MSRINVRYYKAHPLGEEREWSPATNLLWHGMTLEQQEQLSQWSKDVTTVIQNAYEQINTALMDVFKPMQPAIQRIVEASKEYNADYILQHPDEVKAYSAELFKDCEPDL